MLEQFQQKKTTHINFVKYVQMFDTLLITHLFCNWKVLQMRLKIRLTSNAPKQSPSPDSTRPRKSSKT